VSDSARELYDRLAATIAPRRRLLTAFSGGVDSTVVAVAARRVLGRAHAPAAIGDSRSLPRRELEEARGLAEKLDLELLTVDPGEQSDPNYQANAGDRCYHCKTHLYRALTAAAADRGIEHIANGTNCDDLGDHRPGLTAATEATVVSPLVEAGLNKQDVRRVAAHLQLPNADKPAAACLASRLPYRTRVTSRRLEQVEQAEAALGTLGLRGFRVRYHGPVARVELPEAQFEQAMEACLRRKIVEAVKQAGFSYVCLDLEGFRSGSGNILLESPPPAAATENLRGAVP